MKSNITCPDLNPIHLEKYTGCLYKDVLDRATIGILVTNRAGDIRYLNRAYADMFDMTIETALTRNINDYFPNSKLMGVMKTGRPDRAIRFSYKGREALINRYPISDGGEVIGGLLEVYFRDISVLIDLLSEVNRLEKKVQYYKRKTQGLPGAKYTFDDLVGESESIRNFKTLGERFAKSSRPVLLTGESGTGKELVAHAVHSASPRAGEVFISVNCAAIPKDLMEAELFGFEEGTFTGAKQGGSAGKFELADRGTIFLDEIGELPMEMQAKLLRVIENGEIQKIGASSYATSDFRLIAATNKDLLAAIGQGTFREDLYHRLNILVLHVPPLRDRHGDVLIVAASLLRNMAEGDRKGMMTFSPEVQHLFQSYSWPGNIRELRNVLSFACVSLDDGQHEIRIRNLPPYLVEKGLKSAEPSRPFLTQLSQIRQKSEKDALIAALQKSGQNKAEAARILGISRNELYKKMKKYGIPL
ncbi:MAG: sigma 54-interacting transcriptional regulator [Desulfobacteraceae bacterium]|nr:sigma 54-interacting transcriptional regulator [Desulfobacteraceae bacterium]